MRKAVLILVLLLVIGFSLVAWLQPRYEARMDVSSSGNILADLLGDGRKMVADYFYVQADVYFHSGYYPSMFDQARQQEESDSDVAHPEEGNDEEEKGFMGKPLDWIEAFGRHFEPRVHTHLQGEQIREILPWMELSAELDPNRVQTYVVTAYWLRKRMGKPDEAEDFLRAGLRANPRSPDLLYALAEVYLDNRKDYPRARKIFLAALKCWHEVEEPKPEKTETGEGQRNTFLLEQILGGLAEEEAGAGHLDQSLQYLEQLKANAADPAGVQQQIDKLKARMNAEKK